MDLFYYPSYLQYSRLAVYTLAVGVVFGIQSVHPERKFRFLVSASSWSLFLESLRQSVIILSTITVFVLAIKDQAISRAYLFSCFPLLTAFLFATSKWMPHLLSAFAFPGRLQQRTVVVGPPDRVQRFAQWLDRKTAYGLKTIGYVHGDNAPQHPPCGRLPFLGTLCDLETVITSQCVTQLILLETPSLEDVRYMTDLCDRSGVRLLMVNDMADKLGKTLSFMEDDGVQLITFRPEPLECPVNRLLKRLLDIAISLPVVVCVLPFTNLLVYWMQRKEAPGPLFFLQRRTGFQNKEFYIYKYRTMKVGNAREAVQATAEDTRVYPGGRWLRQHSLDELPQFINVLKGEMSVVGPRPHLPEHTTWFNNAAHGFTVRSFIKPGITGLAQVEGHRGEVKELKNLTDRIRSDLFYLENWSLALEGKIIFKTARQIILPPKSAY